MNEPIENVSAKGGPARAIFEVLRAWGIDVVFTCPGSTEAAFLDASQHYPDIRLILVTHEAVAMSAADGFTRATGQPAVAYLHTNVGLANAVAHLDSAEIARSPVIILNGMKSTEIQNRGGFTTASHQRDYIRQHVVFDRIALRGEAIADDLVRALKAATAEPGGPAYLGLPQDLLEADVAIRIDTLDHRKVEAIRRPDAASIARAASTLADSKALIIVAGTEVARVGAQKELLELADKLDAVVMLEEGRTMECNGVPAFGPRFAGYYNPRFPAVQHADVIFFAGAPSIMEFNAARIPNIPASAVFIHLHCDPEEIGKIDRADIALVGNTRLALQDIFSALPVRSRPDDARAEFSERASEAYRDISAQKRLSASEKRQQVPIHIDALAQELHELLGDDCFVVGQPTTAGPAVLDLILADSHRVLHKTSGGSLGWAMGAAVGAALALDKRIYCIIGDGTFQFGIQALATAVSSNLPITFIINDNQYYLAVKDALEEYRGETNTPPWPGTDIAGPNYAIIAQGFGAHGIIVERLSELAAALETANGCNGPAVVSVRTSI